MQIPVYFVNNVWCILVISITPTLHTIIPFSKSNTNRNDKNDYTYHIEWKCVWDTYDYETGIFSRLKHIMDNEPINIGLKINNKFSYYNSADKQIDKINPKYAIYSIDKSNSLESIYHIEDKYERIYIGF